jgi:hypothetical protein
MGYAGRSKLNYLLQRRHSNLREEEIDDVQKYEVDGRCAGGDVRTLSWSERPGSIKLRGKSASAAVADGKAGQAKSGDKSEKSLMSKLSTAALPWLGKLSAFTLIVFAARYIIAYNSGRSASGQMHPILSSLPVVLWFSGIATQLALGVILLSRASYKRFPWFAAYVVQFNVAALILMGIAFTGHAQTYSDSFYLSATIDALLSIMVVGELSVVTFGPRTKRPRLLTLYMGGAMAVAYLIVGTAGSLFMAENPWRRGAQLMLALATATLWVMVLCKERLELYWSDRARGIARGMLLYLTVNMLTAFMNGCVTHATAELAGIGSQAAYLIATILWIKAFWPEQPPLTPPTPEELLLLRATLDDGRVEVDVLSR